MAAQRQQVQQQDTHPMNGVKESFGALWTALEEIPDPVLRSHARKTLEATWNDLAGLLDHAQREIQNGDALIEAALSAAMTLSQQRSEALREIERLQKHLEAGQQAAYEVVMQGLSLEIGAAMGISPDAARLLFDTLIGDLDDFPAVHGVAPEQIHAFRGAMVAMLKALKGGGE